VKSESFEDKWVKGSMGKVRMACSELGDGVYFGQGEVRITWIELGEGWPGQLGEGWPGQIHLSKGRPQSPWVKVPWVKGSLVESVG
jgi:hypothetical protein